VGWTGRCAPRPPHPVAVGSSSNPSTYLERFVNRRVLLLTLLGWIRRRILRQRVGRWSLVRWGEQRGGPDGCCAPVQSSDTRPRGVDRRPSTVDRRPSPRRRTTPVAVVTATRTPDAPSCSCPGAGDLHSSSLMIRSYSTLRTYSRQHNNVLIDVIVPDTNDNDNDNDNDNAAQR